MRPNNTTLMTLVLSLLLTPAALASTWYVNGVSGSDSNHCDSPTTPCKTVGHAISLAASGDTVSVAAATYKENLVITINVTVIGAGASTTIIDGGASASNPVVEISSTAHVTVSNLTIRNGTSGVLNYGTLTLTSSTVSGNGIHIVSCGRTLCMASGGGIYNAGKLIISNSTISGNHVDLSCNPGVKYCFAWGGGILNRGTLLIQDSTVTGNSSRCNSYSCGSAGGALFEGFCNPSCTVTLNNSTVTGNTADRCSGGVCSGMGGAILATKLAMNNSTVSGNPAGGIFNTATLQNSIVANNSGKDCSGTITSHGYNLSSDGSCNFNGPGDMNNTNPNLGPLQNNGGPTQTMALPSGSPAVDAGNPSGCTDGSGHLLKIDQRGMPRPDKEDSGGCDMGAYERQTD